MRGWISSETEILKRIAAARHLLANTINFVLDSAFPHPESAYAQDVLVGINVPRSKLQLAPDQKPGDIDYLIVPFSKDGILLQKTIAIEAKVVRPSLGNPSRNTNTMGRSQTEGLLRDGFPYVGLVHISVPEPLPAQLQWKVPVVSTDLASDGQLIKTGEHFMFDPFPLMSAERQKGRLASLGLPREVGYQSIAMTIAKDGEGFCGNTVGESRVGVQNPGTSKILIKSVQLLLQNEPHLFDVVRWYDKSG